MKLRDSFLAAGVAATPVTAPLGHWREALAGIGDKSLRQAQDTLWRNGLPMVEASWRPAVGDEVEFTLPDTDGLSKVGTLIGLDEFSNARVWVSQGETAVVPVETLREANKARHESMQRAAIKQALLGRHEPLRETRSLVPVTASGREVLATIDYGTGPRPTEDELKLYVATKYPGARILDGDDAHPGRIGLVLALRTPGPTTPGEHNRGGPDSEPMSGGDSFGEALSAFAEQHPNLMFTEEAREEDEEGVHASLQVTRSGRKLYIKQGRLTHRLSAGVTPAVVTVSLLNDGTRRVSWAEYESGTGPNSVNEKYPSGTFVRQKSADEVAREDDGEVIEGLGGPGLDVKADAPESYYPDYFGQLGTEGRGYGKALVKDPSKKARRRTAKEGDPQVQQPQQPQQPQGQQPQGPQDPAEAPAGVTHDVETPVTPPATVQGVPDEAPEADNTPQVDPRVQSAVDALNAAIKLGHPQAKQKRTELLRSFLQGAGGAYKNLDLNNEQVIAKILPAAIQKAKQTDVILNTFGKGHGSMWGKGTGVIPFSWGGAGARQKKTRKEIERAKEMEGLLGEGFNPQVPARAAPAEQAPAAQAPAAQAPAAQRPMMRPAPFAAPAPGQQVPLKSGGEILDAQGKVLFKVPADSAFKSARRRADQAMLPAGTTVYSVNGGSPRQLKGPAQIQLPPGIAQAPGAAMPAQPMVRDMPPGAGESEYAQTTRSVDTTPDMVETPITPTARRAAGEARRVPTKDALRMCMDGLVRRGDYLVMNVCWDPEAGKGLTSGGLLHALKTFAQQQSTHKRLVDLGFIGGIRVDSCDADVGIAEVRFRSSESRIAPPEVVTT